MTSFPTVLALALVPAMFGHLSAQQGEPKPATPTVPAARIQATPVTAAGAGQQPSQDELKAKLADKLAKPFVKHANWTTDYDAARARAKEEGKLVFTYFTRSYSY
ncbi:MAG: hypothetical protein AB7I19_20180 [Planctomycetota bacterium]